MDNIFFESLNKDTLVLTANRRLTHHLQYQYAHYQQIQNQYVWITPTILPLSTWLIELWKKIDESHQVLSEVQERILWKFVSEQDWSSIPSIQQAWNTLQAWDMDENAQTIFQWADQFKQLCQTHHSISSAEIPKLLLQQTEKLSTHLPKSIYLLGFDDFPPMIIKFLEKIKPYCFIKAISSSNATAEIKRFECNDQKTELHEMAAWALREYRNNPNQKIACIVPNLTQIRVEVLSAFYDDSNEPTPTPDINISAGQHLNEFLIIQTALHILQEKWENILQSPYLAECDEDIDIAAFADKMRRSKNVSHFDTKDLLPFFTSLHPHFPESTLLKRWNQFILFKKTIPKKQSLNQHLQCFTKLLQTLHWPGTRTLNTIEHQVLQRWLKALEELKNCDAFLGKINKETALTILQQHIRQIVFQPKSNETAIQVLGILETAGMSFDKLWIMGLDNENWPPAALPNPFLPYALQIQHAMPHASAERELQFTQQMTKRLLNSARNIYLSSAKLSEDNRALTPSQLILHIKPYLLSEKKVEIKQTTTTSTLKKMEYIEDNIGIPIAKNSNITGGVTLLKFQSICPFKAYTKFRLSTEPLEKTALGLSPKLRGQLLHQVLQLLWKDLRSQHNLSKLSTQILDQKIQIAIEATIDTQTIHELNRKFLLLEKKRLQKIITEWLSIEKKRTPFTVIAEESAEKMNIGHLRFQCRIDRIDQLNDGSRLVIDYKTGYSNMNDWFGDRPADPQLPIYHVFSNKYKYDGLAFAQVRAGAMDFKSITNKERRDWDTLTTDWKTSAEKLSQEVADGKANVEPLETACTHCNLQPLCRINECQTL